MVALRAVATAVCAGFAPSRVTPAPRGRSRDDIGTLRGGPAFAGFEPRLNRVYERVLSRRHDDAAAATKHTHYYAPDEKHRRW